MARPEWAKGYTLRDAKKGATINITRAHVRNAVALNGEKCVAARCTIQALSASWAYFYRSVCYVCWDEEPVIERFTLSKRLVQNVIVILDDPRLPNSLITPGRYNLLPPPPGQRLGLNRTPRPGKKGTRKPRHDRGHSPVMGRVFTARGGVKPPVVKPRRKRQGKGPVAK